MRVRLTVPTGELVHETDIPPFNELPHVLIWGDRVFKLTDQKAAEPPHAAIYHEAFSYYIVDMPQSA